MKGNTMKVLWLCNIMLSPIPKKLSEPISVGGGWLHSLCEILCKEPDIQLTACFPFSKESKLISGIQGELIYYCFPRKNHSETKYDKDIEIHFERILKEAQPDVIHIWGTEYPHTLAMVNVCDKLGLLDKVVVSIQGLCSIIAKHYYANLPIDVIKKTTLFGNFRLHNSVKEQKLKFEKRGVFEIEALKRVYHVIGRTTWDKACVSQINKNIKYYFCNEILRDCFYNNRWSINSCERYSIFMSQANYPIKGLHCMLEALPEIIKSFPGTHLYIAMSDITKHHTIKDKLIISPYGKYIKYLIAKNNLNKHVTFMGRLSEQNMCQQFLKTHVFVSASSIENSSNSIGEAKILGVPCISSYVGGAIDGIDHGVDGLFYNFNEYNMLSYYVGKIFGDDQLALTLSENAHNNAINVHDRKENLKRLKSIYNKIILSIQG